jgi:hypothetical protein
VGGGSSPPQGPLRDRVHSVLRREAFGALLDETHPIIPNRLRRR